MGASVYVNAIRDPDGRLGDMIKFALECDQMDMDYPPQLVEYFEGTDALDRLDADSMKEEMVETCISFGIKGIDGLVDGDVEYGNGMTIDLSKLPKEFTKLRVYMTS